MARSRFDPASGCDHTEDLYQVILKGRVTLEEQHRRSPATRSYTQSQARAIFLQAGFDEVTVFREFSFNTAGPDDTLFTVVGQK